MSGSSGSSRPSRCKADSPRGPRPQLCRPDLVNDPDVGVVQCRGGPGFALQTRLGLRVCSEMKRKKLEGHQPIEREVTGLVDHAHSPAAEALEDLVMTTTCPAGRIASERARIAVGRTCSRNQSRKSGAAAWEASREVSSARSSASLPQAFSTKAARLSGDSRALVRVTPADAVGPPRCGHRSYVRD